MKNSFLLRPAAALAAAVLVLAGCGGGGDDGGGNTGVPPGGSAAYAEVAGEPQSCAAGRQKSFVRAYLDEVYLWYNEIPPVDPADYASPISYFNALLVRTPDATGRPKDRFSAALPASQAQDMSVLQDGALDDLLMSHTDAVPQAFVLTRPSGRKVGYIEFTDHEQGAQDDLIAAFRDMQARAVDDLVLDLRRNSGGYLYIALAAASMVTGPAAEGKVFERLQYNAKRKALTDASVLEFSSRLQFSESSSNPLGAPLPQLDLPRVFVLTTGTTCSASESIINSLRGIDVDVIRIGTTTCGKPYGFTRKDNCGVAYFPIEFQGSNAKGFGDYQAGFRPMCQIANNGTPGDTGSDTLLNGAITYIDTNACPAGTGTGVQSSAAPLLATEEPGRPFTGRLLLPQQRPAR
jgi:hypothetical protein